MVARIEPQGLIEPEEEAGCCVTVAIDQENAATVEPVFVHSS
jgi:hypothetical protein